ncbi:aldo/keto reductase [Streptomyces sp. NPDC048594]|uniref:aldo/keto reductase n=1 Tax=Streptomyces sp. NPDC048594 TaxID=3365575 RepID=UPI00371D3DB4
MKNLLIPRRRWGATGLTLPALSVGTAAVGRPAYLTLDHGRDVTDPSLAGMRRLTFEVLDTAYASGIRHVDTAHSYGLAERFTSQWMESRGACDLFLTSKWGYSYVGDWRLETFPQEVKDLSLATFARQAPLSFRRFGDRLGGFQIHSATVDSGVLSDGAVLDAMCALADADVHIGVSTSGPRQAETVDTVVALRESGRVPFGFVQSTWNLLETSAGPALARAAAAGFGVIVKEALANGLLARGDRIPPQVVATARRHGVGPDAVCLAAALALDARPVVLTGPTTSAQLRENLKAVTLDLSAAELRDLTAAPRDPNAYWAARAGLRWT